MPKKYFKTTLSILCLLTFSLQAFAQEGATRANYNFRKTPNGSVKDVLKAGTSFEILGKESPWVKVKLRDGRIGWVHEDGITLKKGKSAPVAEKTPKKPAAPKKVSPSPKVIVIDHKDEAMRDKFEQQPEIKAKKDRPKVQEKTTPEKGGGQCRNVQLKFAANSLPDVPEAGSATIWGGNAAEERKDIDPPFTRAFINQAKLAHERGLEVFAYLEGPCGNTGGKDDGEVAACADLHRRFNDAFSPETSNSQLTRWKPFTFQQMKLSKKYNIDHCEIDNLENNVTIALVPLLKQIKELYDSGEIHCKLVLKNISVEALRSIKEEVAPTPADAEFISPFHIFETKTKKVKGELDQAMKELKGPGSVTILDFNTNAYGEEQTKDNFMSCKRAI